MLHQLYALSTVCRLVIQVTFEPVLPEEARGDQFETATPAHFGQVDREEDLIVTPFDYTAVEIHTRTRTQEPSDVVTHLPDPSPDVDTVPGTAATWIPDVFTKKDGLKAPEPDDETSMGATTVIPHTPSVSSPAITAAPGSDFQGTPEPGRDGASTCGDKEGSSSCGGDEETDVTLEGSAADAPPTQAADTQSSVRTDETEIGGTELPTLVPDTRPRETTSRLQTDNEGSASGEDEASGQDMEPAETPRFTSPLPPLYTTLFSRQPPLAAGAEVTEVPVVLPHVDTVTEAGSGVEQLSGQEEVSGTKGGLIDLPREVRLTLSPDVVAVTSESSTREYPTQSSFVSPGDKQHALEEHAPTTAPPSQPYSLQTDRSTTTLKPHSSQTTPPYSGHGGDAVPQEALIPESTAAPPSEGPVDKENVPQLLESQTETPQETATTEQPQSNTGVSMEASTVNIKGVRTSQSPDFTSFNSSFMWLLLIYLQHFARVDLLSCSTSVCQNGGSCYNNGAQDVCRCAPGYTGQHCETGTHTHTHMHRTTVHQIWMMTVSCLCRGR